MLKRRRGQKTLSKKELLGLLVPLWYRGITLINPTTTRRRTSRRTPQRLNTTNFKKKNKGNCFICDDHGHFASEYESRKWKGNTKSANMVIGETAGTSRYGILAIVLSVCHSPEWWIDTSANIHVCADISLFSSYQVGGTES
jgi:hypothetical protein